MIGIQVELTTGERLRTKVWVSVTREKDFIESFVPGLAAYVEKPGTWNAPIR